MRSPEIDTGIPLVNSNGDDVLPKERSMIAAERGVNSTVFSRALLQAPAYFLPPFMLGAIPLLRNAIVRNPMFRVPMTTYLLCICFGIGLPASIAIFPQMCEIKVSQFARQSEWGKAIQCPLLQQGAMMYYALNYQNSLCLDA